MAFTFKDSCCLITGAANGIGAALAEELAGRGANLVLIDRDESALAAIRDRLASRDITVAALVCDLADSEAVSMLASKVADTGLTPNCLINNAGIGSMGLFLELTESEIQRVFEVNFWGSLRIIRAFLPSMLAMPKARIVNVSSILGLIGAPDQSPYVASKFAIRGFSEALALELAGSSVGVSVVYPGGVATGIAARAAVAGKLDPEFAKQQAKNYNRILKLAPGQAAREIADGIAREKPRILIGRETRIMDLMQRLLGARYLALMIRHGKLNTALNRRAADV